MSEVSTKMMAPMVATFFKPVSIDLVVPYSLLPAIPPSPNHKPHFGAIKRIAILIATPAVSIIINNKVVIRV